MKKLLMFASILLALSTLALAQTEMKPSIDTVLMQRRDIYQNYQYARGSIDTNQTKLMNLAHKTDSLVQIDEMIIEQYLPAELDQSKDLKLRLAENENKITDHDALAGKAKLFHMISIITGGALLLLLVLFIILLNRKRVKLQRTVNIFSGKEELHKQQEEKIMNLEKSLNEQTAQFKKDVEALKASTEREKMNLKLKEEDLNRQVSQIEEKVKKSTQKESDLNYQIFQLEMRLKNELEATVKEKCELENKVVDLERELSDTKLAVQHELKSHGMDDNERSEMLGKINLLENKLTDLERELSETKLALNQELNHPRMDENERNELLGKVSWLENEAPYLRQCIENEKLAKENAERMLWEKGNELDNLFRERDGLCGQIHDLENQLNEKNNLVNDLTWIQNEKNQLLDQLSKADQNEELIRNLNERIAALEQQVAELQPRADEAVHLKEQLEDLIRFVDRLRSGS
jgi:hypothetical protein